jgi:hypothetical protein
MRKDRDRIRTAYHEAGHVVVALALKDIEIDRVSIAAGEWNGGKYRGRTFGQTTASNHAYHLPKYILKSLAGVTAQGRYMRNYFVAYHRGGEDDFAGLKQDLQQLLGHAHTDAAEAAFEKATRELVNGLWPVIEDFAGLLLQRETMEAKEIRKCVAKLLRRHKSASLTAVEQASRFMAPFYSRQNVRARFDRILAPP